MNEPLLTTEIRGEPDVVLVRQRARQVAALLGMDAHDQTRIATAVSEIARNAFLYAGHGLARFAVEGTAPARLVIRISDRGPGITQPEAILAGRYTSRTGLGLGLAGAKKLMDGFQIDTVPGVGTTVELGMDLPGGAAALTVQDIARIGVELGKLAPSSPLDELRVQNTELLRVLAELRARQIEIEANALAREHVAAAERSARAQAEAAVADREQLLAIVSHDLRNPLGVIVNGAQMLELASPAGAVGERARQVAQIVLRAARSMERLIADLLDLARIESGQLAVRIAPHDARSLVLEGVEAMLPLAQQKRLALVGSADAELMIRCDRERMLQILSNLVGNAIKFTPEGGRVAIHAGPDNGSALVSVSDTGEGIAEHELPHVFDRYWQARREDRRGIGLGLSIVKGLVEAQGGRIRVQSEIGAGTTFVFSVPLASSA